MNAPTQPDEAIELAQKRRHLAPTIHKAFRDFSREVFRAGAVSVRVKELIALAVAHVTQCSHCIETHARRARTNGASEQELMEAVWVAAEMRAGAAYAHSLIAFRADRSQAETALRKPVSNRPAFGGEDHDGTSR